MKKEKKAIMEVKDSVIVIVDCYSTGIFFPEKIRNRGYQPVVVFSSDTKLEKLTAAISGLPIFDSFIYDGDDETLLSWLNQYSVRMVIPGFERGVILAERISTLLGHPYHDPRLTRARRDKFLMMEALSEHGVRTMNYHAGGSAIDILNWANSLNSWPYVVKPLMSAGTEMVTVCQSPDEVEHAVTSIIGTWDQFGDENHAALIEEYLAGTEYIADTISVSGVHYLTDFWIYHKILTNQIPIYDYFLLLPYPDEETGIIPYLFSALDALGFVSGPSHSEIMVTPDGPFLIETGARVIGGTVPPDLMDRCIGYNPVDLTLDCLLHPDEISEQLQNPYQLRQHLMAKVLISHTTGTLRKIPHIAEIRRLQSYASGMFPPIGSHITQTISHITSPGKIFLSHPDLQILMKDYEQIRSWEEEGLFITD